MGRGEQMKFAFRKKHSRALTILFLPAIILFWLGLLLDRSTTGGGKRHINHILDANTFEYEECTELVQTS